METSTEYDLETFLDEYKPLFGETTKHDKHTTSRLEQIRRRYFSDSTIVNNNPLSKMKRTMVLRKRNKKQIEEPFLEQTTEEQELYSPSSETVATHPPPQANCITESTTTTTTTTHTSNEPSEIVPQQDLPNDDFNEEIDDEEVELFAENQRSYERKYSINRAANFVRSKAKLLRKRHILNSRCFDKTGNKPEIENDQAKIETNENNNTEQNIDTTNEELNKSKQLRYSWQNARKRMSYVVRLIRRESKEDDEVVLMDEDEEGDFSPGELSRSHSCSSVYEPKIYGTGNVEDFNTLSVMNMKYLSPKGRKLDRFIAAETSSRYSSNENSRKSSRRSSLDSSMGHMNFLSQKYLKQSQSHHSISTHNGEQETTTDNKQHEFTEEHFFHVDDFEQEGDLQCIQNNLYNSADNELGNKQFSIAENEYKDIIDKEVNSYIADYDDNNSKTIQPRAKHVFEQTSHKMADVDNIIVPNIKHTSTISYSVNDLYDLFNKDSKFKSFEVSFDDLVV